MLHSFFSSNHLVDIHVTFLDQLLIPASLPVFNSGRMTAPCFPGCFVLSQVVWNGAKALRMASKGVNTFAVRYMAIHTQQCRSF